MARHPFIETIARYFNGANTADLHLMMSCFTEDIAAYSVAHSPRFGASAVAQFFVDLHDSDARWTIDHVAVQEPEAIVEWSALFTPEGGAGEVLTRGIDWFVFENGRIREIREYFDPRNGSRVASVYELQDFPYEDRRYPLSKTLDSKLPN